MCVAASVLGDAIFGNAAIPCATGFASRRVTGSSAAWANAATTSPNSANMPLRALGPIHHPLHQGAGAVPIVGAETVAAGYEGRAGIEHLVLDMARAELGADGVPGKL